jgi:RNA polymerase sigma-70 factor, ECF subfamily
MPHRSHSERTEDKGRGESAATGKIVQQQETPASTSGDDEQLACQLASGCQDALAILFDRYSSLVFRIARRILRDDGEAEETVQQVFLDVFRSISQFDTCRGSFKSWLLQFAYHRTINRREHLKAKRFYDWKKLDDMLPSELSDGAARPFQLSTLEIIRLIEELLSSVDTRQRRVLELTFFDGLTAEEIAKSSGETASAVRHTLYRSLKKLRSALLEGAQGQRTETADHRAPREGAYLVSPRTL